MRSLFCGAHIRGLKPLFCDARSTNLCFGNTILRFPCFHDLTGSILGSNFIDKQTTLFDNLTKYSSVQTDKGAWFDNLTNRAGNREPELCLEYICTTSFLPAVVAWGAGEPLKIEEVEVAPPQEMEVRIKVHYTALCHTGLYFWEEKGQNPLFPRILGHEAAGYDEVAGYDVQALQSSISKQKYLMHCSVHLLKSK